jgi:hypothetical protein
MRTSATSSRSRNGRAVLGLVHRGPAGNLVRSAHSPGTSRSLGRACTPRRKANDAVSALKHSFHRRTSLALRLRNGDLGRSKRRPGAGIFPGTVRRVQRTAIAQAVGSRRCCDQPPVTAQQLACRAALDRPGRREATFGQASTLLLPVDDAKHPASSALRSAFLGVDAFP